MNQTDKKRVMIITGEASGDLHGGNLVKAIKAKEPSVSFTGIGGDGLRTQGVNILYDIKDLSVSGFTEVFSSLPSIFKALGMVKSFLEGSRPDLLIVIDFAEFNLRVATYAKKYNIPVVYYIPPKIWSWRTYRVKKIKERVDHVAVILPFEADFFNAHGVSARYVGNPLLDDYPQPVPWENKPTAPVIGLLPGSRKSEITQHLPILLDAAQLIQKKIKDATFMLSLAPSADRNYVEGLVASHGGNISIELVSDNVRSIFDKATFLVAASGTVTLEATLA
ncbi:MAG: lipid-A-disaccharide synthase, partial [Desulfobacterales bacterium]|nr:lipid-A-disaccharide synthase [Desulfobacterales bacterium]